MNLFHRPLDATIRSMQIEFEANPGSIFRRRRGSVVSLFMCSLHNTMFACRSQKRHEHKAIFVDS